MLKDYWSALGPPARAGLLLGIAVIVASMMGAAVWLWRTDYQVLFADLKPQDTATMVAELDRMKVPYKIGGDGNTILVDGAVVHATRLKLMGKDLPLHGAAGFELFNNADFGMTEFAQKINYQRALQGEIARTIMSLAEVRDVRVHLALPEEGLFKRSASKAKAAITLSLKTGQFLRAEQVSGIQRLVSSAVPGIATEDVTIVDEQGVALTRVASGETGADLGSGRLDLKRETEAQLSRKATQVLERAFGPGQALASVDVTLNMDQVKVTTEDVLGSSPNPGQRTAGVMVKEREVARDAGPPLSGQADAGGRVGNTQREVEYQVGRRVEQVTSQAGAIRRLQVLAVIRQPMNEPQIEQMRLLVSAAVGAVSDRGDTVVVQSLNAFEPATQQHPAGATGASADAMPAAQSSNVAPVAVERTIVFGLAILSAVVLAAVVWLVRRRSRVRKVRTLDADQRQVVLSQMQQWLQAPAAAKAGVGHDEMNLGARL
ncbi:MAG: fliF [Ramlibacter sp.]|nr:fliF [Ramlibacter sp.]